MRTLLIVGFSLLVGLVGCDKGKSGAGEPAASGSPAAAAAAASGAKKTSLTEAQLDEAYKLMDADNHDKSLAAATGKLGAPQKTEGDASMWYGISASGKLCYQLKLTKTKGFEMGGTDNANCGIQ